MVFPNIPGDGDPGDERRREIQRRLDDLDQRLQAIDARLRDLDCMDDNDLAEAERLSARRHELAAVDAQACVGPLCVIGSGVGIGAGTVPAAGCHVGWDAVIGNGCVLLWHVVVCARVRIGDRVVLNEGSVIGSEGFVNYRDNGEWKKIPHIGTVEISDDVEIGANTTIARARFGKTVFGRGAKIDSRPYFPPQDPRPSGGRSGGLDSGGVPRIAAMDIRKNSAREHVG